MFCWLRSIALLVSLATAGAALAADAKPFAREDMASDVVRLTETLRAEAASDRRADQGQDAGRSAQGRRRGRGRRRSSAPRSSSPPPRSPPSRRTPANWLAYVERRAQGRRRAGERSLRHRRARRDRRLRRLQHSRDARRPGRGARRCSAISSRGTKSGARALDAYRRALDRRDDEDTRKIYEDMREKHGFRIVDYKVDNESSFARGSASIFPMPLARKTDFAPYVAVAGAANAALSSEEQQICVEGLQHGERYAIVVRQGLPSAVGESLLKSADYEIYVRDRSPQAHFAGKAYVLPRQGQHGAPLITVNTAKVSVDVYRVGDRNLMRPVDARRFSETDLASRASEIESTGRRESLERLDGRRFRAQQGRRHRLSAAEAVGKLQPGVYLVTARPWKENAAPNSDNPDNGRAARHAMDGRLRPRPDGDVRRRRRACDGRVHSATAAPIAGVEMQPVARNNEVLAIATTGADGRVDFDPGLSRGMGGSALGLLVASLGDDYDFLNLAQNAVRPDRSRRLRPRRAGRARRLPLHRTRRLSLRRDRLRRRRSFATPRASPSPGCR